MKLKNLILAFVLIGISGILTADDTTVISRSQYDHPDLGHSPGANTHTHIAAIYEKIGDDMNSRFFTEAALADTASVDFNHNFYVDFDQLTFALYQHNTGTDELTTIDVASTPSINDFTIAATGGDLKRQITVTNNTGGAEDIALVVMHDGGASAAASEGSGTGAINYVSNPGAESNIDGWSTYDDGAVSVPIDGTGGSPGITLTRDTGSTEVIRGVASFKITKPAADHQGEGVAIDFTIDSVDRRRILPIEIEYWFSGPIQAGDVQIFVFDKNASMETPIANMLASNGDSSSLDTEKTRILFEPLAALGDYRLVIHIASDNASGWNMWFDSVSVSSQRSRATRTGEINYMNDGDFVEGPDGWKVYDDGAVSVPIDGIGGAGPPTTFQIRWDRETSPIRNRSGFDISKGAVNHQGKGGSRDFHIDRADRSKLLKIEFEYLFIGTGTTLADFVVYIYDIDNATIITPSETDVAPSSDADDIHKFSSSWASTDSDDYRLIIHNASTNSANSWTLEVASLIVGPGTNTTGAIVTDWESFPVTSTYTVNVTHTGQMRRVGSNLEMNIQANFTSLFTAGGAYNFTIPNSLTIDEVALGGSPATNRTTLGIGTLEDNSGSTYHVVSGFTSTTAVRVYNYSGDPAVPTAIDLDVSAVPFQANTNDMMNINISVPILEWKASGVMIQPTSDDLSITGWIAFTPGANPTNLPGTLVSAFYRRNGDVFEANQRWDVTGPVTGSISLGNTAAFPTSSVLTMDTSKMSDQMAVGQCYGFDDSGAGTTNDYTGNAHVFNAGNSFTCRGRTSSGDGVDLWGASEPFIWASPDDFTINYSLPVTQWADLGSVPPIGIQLATGSASGLAGPLDGGDLGAGGPVASSAVAAISAGEYTPVYGASTNCSATQVIGKHKWVRILNIVTVSGWSRCTVTSGGLDTAIAPSVPIADNNFPTSNEINGNASVSRAASNLQIAAPVNNGTASQDANVLVQAITFSGSSTEWFYTFKYKIP